MNEIQKYKMILGDVEESLKINTNSIISLKRQREDLMRMRID